MFPLRPAMVSLAAVMLAGAAGAQPGGKLGTLMIGRYDCERPGTAASALGRRDAAASFTITTSSRYIAADGSVGSYLRTGQLVTMTSGRLAGTKLTIVRSTFLRRLEPDGQPGALRCVLNRATDSR